MTGEAPVLSFDAGASQTSSGKAAASEHARRYIPHFVWSVRPLHGYWRTEKPSSDSYIRGYLFSVGPVSDARMKPGERCVLAHRGWAGGIKALFTIPLTHCHHAVKRDLRPMLLVVRNDNMVHDVTIGKVFHGPAEMGSIDPEHRGALADC